MNGKYSVFSIQLSEEERQAVARFSGAAKTLGKTAWVCGFPVRETELPEGIYCALINENGEGAALLKDGRIVKVGPLPRVVPDCEC